MNRTLKICLVCAAWAAIGTQVALTLNPWLWWIGGVVGAIGGYLTVDWRTVVWAIPIAWRRAMSWRPDRRGWGRVVVNVILTLIWIGEIGVPIAFGLSILNRHNSVPQPLLDVVVAIGIATCLGCGVNVFMARDILSSTDGPFTGLRQRLEKDDQLTLLAPMTTYLNLWTVTIISVVGLLCYLVVGLTMIARHLPRLILTLVRVASKFTWHLYRLIHTEERWLCSVDIACGVALGYWSASPLIGGASGAAFWLVNRLLIASLLLKTLPVRVR